MSDSAAPERLAALLGRYAALVRSAIGRVGGPIIRDAREDVEQEVWLAIWRRLQREQEIAHPTSYLYTVARREALRAVQDALARRRHAVRRDPTDTPCGPTDPHQAAEARGRAERLRTALATLAPDRRRAIEAHLSGLSVDEIQDLFGWSYERARNLIARARADLRAVLREDP